MTIVIKAYSCMAGHMAMVIIRTQSILMQQLFFLVPY